jgi:hypothetical protein
VWDPRASSSVTISSRTIIVHTHDRGRLLEAHIIVWGGRIHGAESIVHLIEDQLVRSAFERKQIYNCVDKDSGPVVGDEEDKSGVARAMRLVVGVIVQRGRVVGWRGRGVLLGGGGAPRQRRQ